MTSRFDGECAVGVDRAAFCRDTQEAPVTIRFRLLACLALLAGAGCSSDVPPGTAADAASPAAIVLPPELDRVLRDYEAAYGQRDAMALARLFAEDGYVLQPGRPPVRGRHAVAAALRGEGGPLTLVPIDFAVDDSAGYIIGTFGAERAANEGGKFVLALRRGRDGQWQVAADIANSNR